MEISALYFLIILGCLYHITVRKYTDFLSISFFGMAIYFSPGLVGFVIDPYHPRLLPSVPIDSATYYIFLAALSINLIFSAFSDRRHISHNAQGSDLSFDKSLVKIIALLLIMTFILAVLESGRALLSPDKDAVLESRGRFFVLFSVVAQFSLFIGLFGRSKLLTTMAVAAMAFLIFIGFRSFFATAVIAIIARLAFRSSIRSFLRPSTAAATAIVGLFLLLYKQFYIFIKMGRGDLVSERLFSDGFVYKTLFSSEPFIVQFNLNEVVLIGYSEPASKILLSPLLLIPGFTQLAGIPEADLNFNFQDLILPGVQYGVGSNIYAHWFATMGWVGILIFSLCHNAALLWLGDLARRTKGVVNATIFLVGSFLCFYINRNDMFYTMQSIERYLLVCAVIATAGYVVRQRVVAD